MVAKSRQKNVKISGMRKWLHYTWLIYRMQKYLRRCIWH